MASTKVEAWESTPLTNFRAHSHEEIMSMHLHLKPPVQALKQRLGKQSYTWVGEFRYWVWEKNQRWRVFAANGKGVSFEVNDQLSEQQALKAWDDFCQAVQLPKDLYAKKVQEYQ